MIYGVVEYERSMTYREYRRRPHTMAALDLRANASEYIEERLITAGHPTKALARVAMDALADRLIKAGGSITRTFTVEEVK